MPNRVYVQALRRAAEILGGPHQLRAYLRVPVRSLELWMEGTEPLPTDFFLKVVDVLSGQTETEYSALMQRSSEVLLRAERSTKAAQLVQQKSADLLKRSAAARQRSLEIRTALMEGRITGVARRPQMSTADFMAKDFSKSEGALLLESALNAAVNDTAAARANIQLVHRDDLYIVGHIGFEKPFLDFFATVRHETPASCGRAYERGQRTIVTDVANDPIFAGTFACDVMREAKALACQSTPLLDASGEVIGMFSTHYDKPHQPSSQELATLELISQRTSTWLAGQAVAR